MPDTINSAIADDAYSQDTVSIGNALLPNLPFGLADDMHISTALPVVDDPAQFGTLRLAFTGMETSICPLDRYTFDCPANFTYSTVVDALYNEGYIKSCFFSVYLNDMFAPAGSILFGGIDTAHSPASL